MDSIDTCEYMPSSGHLPLTREELTVRLMLTEKRFRRACEQVSAVNRKIHALERRYYKARADERRSYRYILRMRLMSTENVRDMFYVYAAAKADEVMALRKQLGDAWEEQLDDVTDFVDSHTTDTDGEEYDEEDLDEDEEEEEDEAMEEESEPQNQRSAMEESEIRTQGSAMSSQIVSST